MRCDAHLQNVQVLMLCHTRQAPSPDALVTKIVLGTPMCRQLAPVRLSVLYSLLHCSFIAVFQLPRTVVTQSDLRDVVARTLVMWCSDLL